jgi:pyridoxamine 5'-phosphate oxidase
MNKSEMLALIKKCGYGFVATVDGNKARVRGMEVFRVDEKGIIFYSNKTKDVAKQIAKNQEVEVCYFSEGTQLRISGRIEIVQDQGLKKEIVEARPFLKEPVAKQGWDYLTVYRLARGKATTWSMQTMADPKTYVDF